MPIDIKKDNFELGVIQKSHTTPVLVDFWASWCSPCKVLKPILEKLEKDFNNRFLLAKINTETEKELANSYKISSIPYVALFHKGIVIDSFIGALSENLVKKFLDKNLPHPSSQEIENLMKNGMFELAAQKILGEDLKGEIFDEYLWSIYKYNLQKNEDFQNLKELVEQMSDYGSRYSEIKNVLVIIHKNIINDADLKSLLKIFNIETVQESLDYFLKNIEDSSGTEKEKHKNYLFFCFLILDKNPLVTEYRKKLSRILF